MKNSKGMTLVEVVIAMGFVSIIAVVFFKAITFGYTNIVESDKYTLDSFKVQQDIENKINILKDKEVIVPGTDTKEIKVFGKDIKGHVTKHDIKSKTTSKHGEYIAFIPKIDVTYKVPTVSNVSLYSFVSGVEVADKISMINKKGQVDTSINFRGDHTDGSKEFFLMNVYRWYVSPLADPYPSDVKDFIRLNSNNFIILKEWNASRKKQDYVLNDLSMIPNIENDYDEFSFSEIKLDVPNKDQILIDMFSGKFIIYSVTPYSSAGKMGKEMFSDPIYIEPVK